MTYRLPVPRHFGGTGVFRQLERDDSSEEPDFGTLSGLRDSDLTKLLGYRVYRHEINERAKTLKLWIRRKRGNRKLVCSGCARKLDKAHEVSEREVRDLPHMEFRTTVAVEVYRVCCPDCGIKMETVPPLPSKAPFSKPFEGRGGASMRGCGGTTSDASSPGDLQSPHKSKTALDRPRAAVLTLSPHCTLLR